MNVDAGAASNVASPSHAALLPMRVANAHSGSGAKSKLTFLLTIKLTSCVAMRLWLDNDTTRALHLSRN